MSLNQTGGRTGRILTPSETSFPLPFLSAVLLMIFILLAFLALGAAPRSSTGPGVDGSGLPRLFLALFYVRTAQSCRMTPLLFCSSTAGTVPSASGRLPPPPAEQSERKSGREKTRGEKKKNDVQIPSLG